VKVAGEEENRGQLQMLVVRGCLLGPPGFRTAAPLGLLPASLRAGSELAAWATQGAGGSGGSGCDHNLCAVPRFKARWSTSAAVCNTEKTSGL